MKHFCVLAALWHAGSSMVLPGSGSYVAVSVRSEDPRNPLQTRGDAEEPSQSPLGNSLSRSHSMRHGQSTNIQSEKNHPLKRDRSGVPFSPPPIQSLNLRRPPDTISSSKDKTTPPSYQKPTRQMAPTGDANLDHSNRLERSIPRHDTRKSADQLDSKRPGLANTTPSSFPDYQDKGFRSRTSHNTMPPPPARLPKQHIAMDYSVDDVVGNSLASYPHPPMEKSDKPSKSTEPGFHPGSGLTRRSATNAHPLLQSTNHDVYHSAQRLLQRRGFSPFWVQSNSDKETATKKGSDAPEQPSPNSPTQKPRVLQLPGNIAAGTSQPHSSKDQRRRGTDLSSGKQPDGSNTSGRNALVRSVYETSAYLKNSWQPLHKENNPPPSDGTSSSAADAKRNQKRSIISPRTAAPGREHPPRTPSPPRNPNSPRRTDSNTQPSAFRSVPPPQSSFPRDHARQEEALRNAAARARQTNLYPPIHYNGLTTTPPPRGSHFSTYPVIPSAFSMLPPSREQPNGVGTAHPSDSDPNSSANS
ncbi:MAG: hypothetical protein GOMPHAMPRED_002586 [Gomphillus americanus]|uniref:Uncharacterized protein n=1 Tax=Gomphillus americanus TaxID=1940652 RepID=A0A8H3IC12_9LECA|nr:MAG: hypothetical protein GOMPHAMPRED_002586 [Gomphillus americanus]